MNMKRKTKEINISKLSMLENHLIFLEEAKNRTEKSSYYSELQKEKLLTNLSESIRKTKDEINKIISQESNVFIIDGEEVNVRSSLGTQLKEYLDNRKES